MTPPRTITFASAMVVFSLAACDAPGPVELELGSAVHPHLGLDAFDDGTLVVSHTVSPSSPADVRDSYTPQIIAGYDVEGSQVREYASTPRLFRLRGVTPMGDLPTSAYAVDPAGRVYVTDGATYDRDGNHLFSGTHDAVPWNAAQGDLVYAIEDDEDSGGHVVVAYRLIEPFE